MVERDGYPVNGSRWIRGLPDHCEICGHPILVTFYHAQIKGGSYWAVMCPSCFLSNGAQGQRFLIDGASATKVKD